MECVISSQKTPYDLFKDADTILNSNLEEFYEIVKYYREVLLSNWE